MFQNTLRILTMPQEIQDALGQGKISEGHTDRFDVGRQTRRTNGLFKEIMLRKLTVREAEAISRKIAYDKVRKQEYKLTRKLQSSKEKKWVQHWVHGFLLNERRMEEVKVVIDFFG